MEKVVAGSCSAGLRTYQENSIQCDLGRFWNQLSSVQGNGSAERARNPSGWSRRPASESIGFRKRGGSALMTAANVEGTYYQRGSADPLDYGHRK